MDPSTSQQESQTPTTPSEQDCQENPREEYKDYGVYEARIEEVQVPQKIVAPASYGPRIRIARIYSDMDEFLYKIIQVAGWARTMREGGKDFCFLELNDGSTIKSLQIVIDKCIPGFDELSRCKQGSSFHFTGTLVKSPKQGQPFELQLSQPDKHSLKVYGYCDPGKYPLSKKNHSNEFLREIAHLRPRTQLIGAVTRVRNNLALATHLFFQSRGFLYIHTPIITASDCEGAGEMFQVTTVLPPADEPISKMPLISRVGQVEEEEAKENAEKMGQQQKKPKKEKGGKQEKQVKPSAEEIARLKEEKLKKKQEEEEKKQKMAQDGTSTTTEEAKVEEQKPLIPFEERKVNYRKDLFHKPSFLTVSGQLSVENYCCALTDCYTFGPTFRAENSHTSRHLSEFWMIEPELAFATLQDNMQCAEEYLKFCLKYVMENNRDEMEFFDKSVEKGLLQRLVNVIETPFRRIEYTEAVGILERDIKHQKVKFENHVYWGVDLASEHEKYLTDKVFNGPIILYNYPKDIKAFYMKVNDDNTTVQAMDVLVPRIGEVIGGSAREENLEKLDRRITECKLEMDSYWWYRDLRQYGTVPHAGFGLGFERLVMMATGVENIKDVIPFPRAPGAAEF